MTDVGYYDNMKQELWEGDYDAVLFELIVPSDLAHTDSRGRRRPRSGAATAAPREQAMARGLRLELQLDALGPDFEAAPTWQCADLSKEEIIALQAAEGAGPDGWWAQLAETVLQQSAPSRELRPSLLPQSYFIRAEAPSVALRACLWLLPSPEAVLLAFDTGALGTGAVANTGLGAVVAASRECEKQCWPSCWSVGAPTCFLYRVACMPPPHSPPLPCSRARYCLDNLSPTTMGANYHCAYYGGCPC